MGNRVYVANGAGGLRILELRLVSPVTPVHFDAVRFSVSGNEVQLRVEGALGRTMVLESSQDLLFWVPVLTNLLTEGVVDITVPVAPKSRQSFHRVRVP